VSNTFTGLLALATAALVFGTAIVTWRTRKQVQEVHVMVNRQRDEMTEKIEGLERERTETARRVDQLETALRGSDTDVPPAPTRTDGPR
jgi:cell division protein FtsB